MTKTQPVYDKKYHRTLTQYLTFEHTPESLRSKIINRSRNLFNWLFKPVIGHELKPQPPRQQDICFNTDEAVKDLQYKKIAQRLYIFLKELNIERTVEEIVSDVRDYDFCFRNCTVTNLQGGMGYNNGLVVFVFTRAVSPGMILESGVWRGFSTYILDQASSEQALIKCFDINLSRLEWRSSKAEYFEADITESKFDWLEERRLALFDDHVPHYTRLKYSLEHNIDFIILDDDVSVETTHSDGWPPIPTASMIMNYDSIPHEFTWSSHDRRGLAKISGLECQDIQEGFYYQTLPDLWPLTGYQSSSFTSFLVRNKNK